ncbi:unnamed protein product [Mycena citricolor]|uniref:Zn(2)-C6 fungal-type domain-containing protein n=1 Tax=Mycena citricolor TaxID=2018698 RepID=A0AAD2I099_9AGAR|nr:unnamed protein product [Mycena citricolor]
MTSDSAAANYWPLEGAPIRRMPMACVNCRRRKIKCVTSTKQPSAPCERCTKRKLDCEFVPVSESAEQVAPHRRSTLGGGKPPRRPDAESEIYLHAPYPIPAAGPETAQWNEAPWDYGCNGRVAYDGQGNGDGHGYDCGLQYGARDPSPSKPFQAPYQYNQPGQYRATGAESQSHFFEPQNKSYYYP